MTIEEEPLGFEANIKLVEPRIDCVGCGEHLAEHPGPLIQRYCPSRACARFGLMTLLYDTHEVGEVEAK